MVKIFRRILPLCLLSTQVYGDVTVVRSLRVVPHTTQGVIEARGILQIQGALSRRQTDVHVEGDRLSQQFAYSPRTITLVSLNKNLVHRFDSQQFDFEKFSLADWRTYLDKRQNAHTQLRGAPFQITQSWSRVIAETGEKTIRNVPCQKFVYEWRFQVTHPETYARKEFSVRTTLWLAEFSPKVQQTLAEEAAFRAAYHKKLGSAPMEDLNGLTLQYAEQITGVDKHALFAGLSEGTTRLKRIPGYPLASQTEWIEIGPKKKKALFTVHAELEALTVAPLSAKVFLPKASPLSEAEITARMITRAK